MMLYKIVRLVGDHGVSVFPAEGKSPPPDQDLSADLQQFFIFQITAKGYSSYEAKMALEAWAAHARSIWPVLAPPPEIARGVKVFTEMCIRDLPMKGLPPAPPLWGIVIGVAVIVAAALGLYLWVTLDKKLGVTFGSHKWSYVMRYEERLWQGEILNVGYKQLGYYEQGGELWSGTYEHRRREAYIGRWLDRMLFFRRFVLAGRRLIFFHEYRWIYWDVFFCGVLTNIGNRLYKLREGGSDPYKPRGPWSRPGGRMFTPEYEGCWQEFWWL